VLKQTMRQPLSSIDRGLIRTRELRHRGSRALSRPRRMTHRTILLMGRAIR